MYCSKWRQVKLGNQQYIDVRGRAYMEQSYYYYPRSSAGPAVPRWVTLGSLGTAPAFLMVQTLTAAWPPATDWDSFALMMWVNSRMEGQSARYIWCKMWSPYPVSRLECASPNLSNESESPCPGWAYPLALGWASTGQQGASESSKSLCLGRACHPAFGPGRHWQGPAHPSCRTLCLARPWASESQDSVPSRTTWWGDLRRGEQAGVLATWAKPRLSCVRLLPWLAWLASRRPEASPRAGGWVQNWSNSDNARRVKHHLDCADLSWPLNSALSHAILQGSLGVKHVPHHPLCPYSAKTCLVHLHRPVPIHRVSID